MSREFNGRPSAVEIIRASLIGLTCLLIAAAFLSPQLHADTFTADATVKGANGAAKSAKLTVTVKSFATDAEREALVAAVKKGGNAARDLLKARADAGVVEVGTAKTAIKYAYARPSGSGQMITVVTAEPIHFVGGDLPDAKPKAGYDLGLALLELDPAKPGTGEIAPAAKVRVDAEGGIVIEDYGGVAIVRLTNVVRR